MAHKLFIFQQTETKAKPTKRMLLNFTVFFWASVLRLTVGARFPASVNQHSLTDHNRGMVIYPSLRSGPRLPIIPTLGLVVYGGHICPLEIARRLILYEHTEGKEEMKIVQFVPKVHEVSIFRTYYARIFHAGSCFLCTSRELQIGSIDLEGAQCFLLKEVYAIFASKIIYNFSRLELVILVLILKLEA